MTLAADLDPFGDDVAASYLAGDVATALDRCVWSWPTLGAECVDGNRWHRCDREDRDDDLDFHAGPCACECHAQLLRVSR